MTSISGSPSFPANVQIRFASSPTVSTTGSCAVASSVPSAASSAPCAARVAACPIVIQ